MSPAKRPSTEKKTRARSRAAADREVALPNESEQTQTAADSAAASDDVESRIRQKAYEIYCSRNADGGNELDDWFAAEREVRFGHASTEGRAPALLESLSEDEERDVAR